jgi:hypothetical protein
LLFPDLILGPLDDALIIWLSTVLFVELCPPDIVQEHRDAIDQVIHGEWKDQVDNHPEFSDEDIIEGEYRDQ